MNLEQFPGVNAGYVLELYERYRQDPESVDPATRKAFEGWTPRERAPAAGPPAAPVEADCRSSSAPPTWPSRSAATAISPRASIRWDRRRSATRRCRPRAHGITDERPEAAAGVARRRSGRRSVGQRLRGHREAAPRLLLDDRLRLRAGVRAGRARVAAARRRVGPVPAADGREQRRGAARSHHAGRGVRALPAPHVSRARRASRSKGSTCSCRSSTRSSAAPPTAASGTRMLGMAHRGRLNVLAHVLQKPYAQILAEFKDPVQRTRCGSTWAGWAT